MTAHSPVGLAPEKFGVRKAKEIDITFADNDVEHVDTTGVDHESFGYGLKKSLLNYMHAIGLDETVQKWFDFKVPRTTIQTDYIASIIENTNQRKYRPESILVFLGQLPKMEIIEKSKKGNHWKIAAITFQCRQHAMDIRINLEEGEWLINLLRHLIEGVRYDMKQVQSDYESRGLENFELFWDNKPINQLHKAGLLML
jgi:hypothetical protein